MYLFIKETIVKAILFCLRRSLKSTTILHKIWFNIFSCFCVNLIRFCIRDITDICKTIDIVDWLQIELTEFWNINTFISLQFGFKLFSGVNVFARGDFTNGVLTYLIEWVIRLYPGYFEQTVIE